MTEYTVYFRGDMSDASLTYRSPNSIDDLLSEVERIAERKSHTVVTVWVGGWRVYDRTNDTYDGVEDFLETYR